MRSPTDEITNSRPVSHQYLGDPRPCAVALVRWALGLLFLLFGLGKLPDPGRFVAYYILAPLEKTWLPKWLLLPFGYAMPYIEILLGLLLLLGLWRNPALIAAGVYLMLQLLGQALFTLSISETIFVLPPLLFNSFMYVVITAALLFLDKHDRWVFRRNSSPPAPVSSGSYQKSGNIQA